MQPFSFDLNERKYGVGDWSRRELSAVSGRHTTHYSGCFSNLFGTASGGSIAYPSPTELTKMRDKVNARLLDKLKGSSVNLSQVYAERKLTTSMIEKSAIRIAASLIELKKGKFGEAAKMLGVGASRRKTAAFNAEYRRNKDSFGSAVANGWLELQYGWRPLLQDIYGSAEWLAKQQTKEIRQKVVSRQVVDFEFIEVYPKDQGQSYIEFRKYHAEVSGVVWFSTTGSELASTKEAGLLNPAYLAWELLPYSFVVDWFLPVGNFLSNLDATLGLRFDKGCYTTFVSSQTTTRSTAFNELYDSGIINCNIRGSSRKVTCSREIMSDFPSVQLPSFKNPLGVEHALNAIALLTQVFKR